MQSPEKLCFEIFMLQKELVAGWTTLKQAGFLDCSSIHRGDMLDAFVLSDAEPFLAFFKRSATFGAPIYFFGN